MILQNHKRLPVCIFSNKMPLWGLWRGCLTGFSEWVSNFKGASYNFEFDFFIYEETRNRQRMYSTYRKYQFNTISLQKNIYLVTQSLSGKFLYCVFSSAPSCNYYNVFHRSLLPSGKNQGSHTPLFRLNFFYHMSATPSLRGTLYHGSPTHLSSKPFYSSFS